MPVHYILLAGFVLLVLLVIDWRQTLRIAEPGGWHELNPILGHEPTPEGVHWYFTICMVLAAGLIWLATWSGWALSFLVICTLVQATVVLRNYRMGIKP